MASPTERDEYLRLQHDFADFLWFLPDGFLEAEIASAIITSINRMACLLLGYDPEDPPRGLRGPDVVAAGEFERLFAYHMSLVGPALAAGRPYERTGTQDLFDVRMRRRDDTEFIAETQGSYVLDKHGVPERIRFIFRDVTDRRQEEDDRTARLRALERILPVCAWCHRIRDEEGRWQQLEAYIHSQVGYDFSHGICSDCETEFEIPSPSRGIVPRSAKGSPSA